MKTDPKAIRHDLYQLLNRYVPTDQYLNAENIARHTEETDGTLTDLRDHRERVMQSLDELVVNIARLQDEVYGQSAMDGGLKDPIAELFRGYGAVISQMQRKHPMGDEHPGTP